MTRIPLEDELKKALRRQQSPEGFTDRVLARASRQSSAQQRAPHQFGWAIFSRPLFRWPAMAAISLALVAGSLHYRQIQVDKARIERAQGEAAKQRLMLALRIAGSKLQMAKAKVNETTETPGANPNPRSRSKS
jgi:hypothetical protein